MTAIECHESGVVYRNPKPYLRSVHAYHPSLAVFDDGEMVVGFDLGAGSESLDYRTHVTRSTDGGHTWQPERRLFSDPPGRPTSCSVRISRVGDGLVGFGSLAYRDDPNEGLINRETLGYVPMDLVLVRGDDRGESWTPPDVVRPAIENPAWESCHSIIELADGRWLAPTAAWRGWNGDFPAGEQAVVLISEDRGRTWPGIARTFDGRQSGVVHWEQSVIPLQDGRMLAIAWAHDPKDGRNLPTPYSLSRDGGRTFLPPRPTGLQGQTCKGIQLRDGRIFSVYRRCDRPGLWANLSVIDGEDWINRAEAPLWQGAAMSSSESMRSADDLADLRFGYPSMHELPDGDVFVVFWCVEDCVSNIRWLRVRVSG